MPLFHLHALDKAGALDVRLANRAAHLDWARSYEDKILMAGPMFAEDGETFAGSAFVLNMDSLETVRAWAAEDPYARAGLFQSVEIRPFKWVIGSGPDD